MQEEKKFLNTTLGERHSFRFRWGIDSYNKSDRRFAVVLTISQANYTPIVERDKYTLNNYPEIVSMLNTVGITPTKDMFQIRIPFEKNDTAQTVISRILTITSTLLSGGITQARTQGLGFVPDLSYATAYLEYTMSDENLSTYNILLAMCNGDRDKLSASLSNILAKSDIIFNPEEDTDLNFIIQRNEARMDNIQKNLEILNKMVHGSSSDKSSKVESTETYSSEDSKDYSKFQCNWI